MTQTVKIARSERMRENESNLIYSPTNSNINAMMRFMGFEDFSLSFHAQLDTAFTDEFEPWGLNHYAKRMKDNFVAGDIAAPNNKGDKALVENLRRTMNALIDRNFDLYAIIEEKEKTGQMFDLELLEKAQIVAMIQELDLKIHLICKV